MKQNLATKRILMVGCGDIALRVAALLRGRHLLFGLARRAGRCAELRAAGILPLSGDLDSRASLARLAGLADVVLHFAPPATPKVPSPTGGRSGRGTQERGEVKRDLRTRNLLAALSRGKLPARLVYISTSGVYGDCAGARVNETRALNPQTARARLRADAERQIRSWAERNHVGACILRVPGIYAAGRLPLERLRAGMAAIARDKDSYTNHIHADDLARIVAAALRYGKPGRVFHACDDSEMKMGDYFDAVADAFNLPRPPRLSRAETERSVSPALWSFMNESRRLANGRMKKELGVRLRYPTLADALECL